MKTILLSFVLFISFCQPVFAERLIMNPTTGKLDWVGMDKVTDVGSDICTASQVIKKNAGNTAWECAADATGAGGGDPILIDTVAVTDASGVDLTGGTTGIDISFNAAVSPDTATWAFDATELEALTWGAGGNASNIWTFNLSGTDPTITFNSGAVAIGGALSATGAVTGSNLSGTNTGDNTVATSGDSATSFFSTGTLEVAIGGTGTTTSTGTGAVVLGTAPDLTVSATTETNFEAALDIAGDVSSTGMATTVIGADKVLESHLKAVDAAVDEECLTYETTTGDFEWQACGSGGGDSVSVDGVAVVDPNFASTGDIDFVDTANVVTANINVNAIVDGDLAITESINLPIYSAKLTRAFVVFTPPTADACTQGAQIDAGDGNWRLLFDPTTDECATWQFVLPDYWAAHSELKIFYTMTSATANEVDFEAAVMCVTPGDAADIGTAGFANVATASDTVPGTVGYLDSVSITITDDSCAAGDVMFVVISKDANDATLDDATGDTEIVGVVYEFTR